MKIYFVKFVHLTILSLCLMLKLKSRFNSKMNLRLPKKISPDPLLSSTVELRFTSDLSSEETLTLLRPKYIDEFPKLSERGIATQKSNRPELEYIAEYILSGKDYHIFLDKNVIAFENIGEYHLWDSYYDMIKEKLKILADTIPIKSIQRVGLRYVSFFPTTDKFSKVLKFNFNVPIEGYKLENELFRTLLCRDNSKLLLNLAKNVQIERNLSLGFTPPPSQVGSTHRLRDLHSTLAIGLTLPRQKMLQVHSSPKKN